MIGGRAILGILAANALALAIALWQRWPLAQQLWPYWLQNLIIGGFALKRILALRAFSTEGLLINGREVAPTRATQRWVAGFFALHYGLFHLFYFVFLLTLTSLGTAPDDGRAGLPADSLSRQDLLLILALGVGFWLSHRASYRENIASDLQGRRNLGTLMFLPYARVVPMHLTIILAMPFGGAGGTLLFGGLKTAADIAMHIVEHRWLRGRAQTKPPA